MKNPLIGLGKLITLRYTSNGIDFYGLVLLISFDLLRLSNLQGGTVCEFVKTRLTF